MMYLPNRPIPAALLDRADPLARGLVCATMMNEPGGASGNLANAGLLIGTPAAGGLATNVTGIHQPWHNRFGSGYTLALWHSGITLSIYGALFYLGDNTLHWQRDGLNGYLRVSHNGVTQSMSDLLTSDIADPGLLVCLWDGNQLHAYIDGLEVGSAAMTTAPKTISATSALTIGGACTVHQFLAYDRALSATEIKRLYADSGAPFVEANLWPAVLVAPAVTHDLRGSVRASTQLSATLRAARRIAGSSEVTTSTASVLRVIKCVLGSSAASVELGASLSVNGVLVLTGSLTASSSASGVLSLTSRVPNAVVGLSVVSVAGSKVRLIWFYCPLAQQVAPDRFGIYIDDEVEPVALIAYVGRKFYAYVTSVLSERQHRFAVRAERAGRDQQGPMSFVTHSIQSRQPESLTILTAEAIP